jgi:hypothetical protein
MSDEESSRLMHCQNAGTGRACSSASGLKADMTLVDEKERHAEEYNMRMYAWKFPAELQNHDHPDGPWQVVSGEMDWAGDGLGLRAPGGAYNRGVPPARPPGLTRSDSRCALS